jgi:hypothetical protein
LSDRFAEAPSAPEDPTPVEVVVHRLKTPKGKTLYALRKQTRNRCSALSTVLGFRQLLLRRLDQVPGEWNLVTLA